MNGIGFLKLPLLGPEPVPVIAGRKAGHGGSWMCQQCHRRATANKGKICTRCLRQMEARPR